MIPKILKFLPAICYFVISGFSPVISQSLNNDESVQPDLYTYILKKYGFDHELINGIQYYNKYRRVLNHPYYIGGDFFTGSVTLSGKKFNHVLINYDIYSQYLILEYQDIIYGGIHRIILNPEHTDAFEMDGNYFERLNLDERGPLFYQVIRKNYLTCYIHWKKELYDASGNLQYPEYFSESQRSYFIDIYGNLFPFKNKKTFASSFSGNPKKQIKKYMRQHTLNFNNVTIKELTGLLEFISSGMTLTSGN